MIILYIKKNYKLNNQMYTENPMSNRVKPKGEMDQMTHYLSNPIMGHPKVTLSRHDLSNWHQCTIPHWTTIVQITHLWYDFIISRGAYVVYSGITKLKFALLYICYLNQWNPIIISTSESFCPSICFCLWVQISHLWYDLIISRMAYVVYIGIK